MSAKHTNKNMPTKHVNKSMSTKACQQKHVNKTCQQNMSTNHVNKNMSRNHVNKICQQNISTNHVNKLPYMERNQNMGKSISARFKNTLTIINITGSQKKQRYRSGMVNSKSFITKLSFKLSRNLN